MHHSSRPLLRLALAGLLALAAPLAASADDFANFESAQVHPISLSADAGELYAVNTPDGRLSIFSVEGDGSLTLSAEIPVGVEPVSLAVHGTEVWVVNHISDSISVVDTAARKLVATIRCGDEPTDIVFANGRAFVSMAGGRDQVKVYDATSRAEVGQLDIFGDDPRALAVSADGSEVYLVVLESGNQTISMHLGRVKAGGGSPPPNPPKVSRLPAPPATALIVGYNPANGQWEDETGRSWTDSSELVLPDHDIFVIDTTTLAVTRTADSIGTTLFDIAVQPGSGRLWVANTDALNLLRFEPNLRGHFVDTRLSIVDPLTADRGHFDLNPHIDYGVSPGPPSEIANSVAIPGDIQFNADGTTCYVAAFGSANVAVIDTAGGEIDRIAVGGGPSGLALAEATGRLYVVNRFDNTISIVDTVSRQQLATVGIAGPSRFDPSPESIRNGRRFLYDATLSSGHGDVACASCHVFGNFDGLAWDLGDPTGSLLFYRDTSGLVFSEGPPLRQFFHPMKGPMVTQTLRGLEGLEPFHWRGDKPSLQDFNGAFVSLMGRDTPLPAAEMDAFADFMNTILMPPNPNRTLDDGLPDTIAVPEFGGMGNLIDANPANGENIYFNGLDAERARNCEHCHPLPNGTNNTLNSSIITSQDMKISQIRNTYEKADLRRIRFGEFGNLGAVEQKSGFGVLHDGASSLMEFLVAYFLGEPSSVPHDMAAFVMAFPSGTAPVVGHQLTLNRNNARTMDADAEIGLMLDQAAQGKCDLVVTGVVSGSAAGFVYDLETETFLPNSRDAAPLTDVALRSSLEDGDVITYTAVPAGSGRRIGIDRDRDTWLDADEVLQGTDASDPDSAPITCVGGEAGTIEGLRLKFKPRSDGMTFALRGTVDLTANMVPPIDVAESGMLVDVRDADSAVVFHRWIPSGSWQRRGDKGWRFSDKTGTKARGIHRADVRKSSGVFGVDIRGRGLDASLDASAFPLTIVVVFGTADQEIAGQCGRLDLEAARCRISSSTTACR